MSTRLFTIVAILCWALSTPFPAIAQSITVDVCAGADLHWRSGSAHSENTVSITQGGTYPIDPSDFRFGCPRDTPAALLGSADVTVTQSPGAGPVEHMNFHFTAGPNIGDIIVEGTGAVLVGNGGCPTPTDLAILSGTGAFSGIKGVAHFTGINPTVCQVAFAPQ